MTGTGYVNPVKSIEFKYGRYFEILVLINSPVSVHGVHQQAQNDIFVCVHEKVQVTSIFRNRDTVLLDDSIYGRSNSRLLSFSNTGVADVVTLGEQTRRKTL
jgi:hypothetical protein